MSGKLKGLLAAIGSIVLVVAIIGVVFFLSPAKDAVKGIGALKESLDNNGTIVSYSIGDLDFIEVENIETEEKDDKIKLYCVSYVIEVQYGNTKTETSLTACFYAGQESSELALIRWGVESMKSGAQINRVFVGFTAIAKLIA